MSKVTIWNPFQDLAEMHDRVNKMVNDSFGAPLTSVQLPATDVYQEDDTLIVEASLPNFTEKDVTVHVTHDGVEIKAIRTEETEDKNKKRKYYMRESRSGLFYRFIALPSEADKDKAEAHFKDGMLKVTIPLEARPQPKKLTVKTSK